MPGETLVFTGASSQSVRNTIIENFDAKVHFPKDDYRILITTEVLAEGVNLHRSNVVINYDIPWNPTRLMQRESCFRLFENSRQIPVKKYF